MLSNSPRGLNVIFDRDRGSSDCQDVFGIQCTVGMVVIGLHEDCVSIYIFITNKGGETQRRSFMVETGPSGFQDSIPPTS